MPRAPPLLDSHRKAIWRLLEAMPQESFRREEMGRFWYFSRQARPGCISWFKLTYNVL